MNDPKQPDLFLPAPKPPMFAKPKELEPTPVGARPCHRNLKDEAMKWIGDHPEEMALMLKYAQALARKGRPRIAISMIFEHLRYEYEMSDREAPKLNNSHRSFVSRWMAAKDPSLEKLLKFREVGWDEGGE